MSFNIILSAGALKELHESVDWYEGKKEGLGTRFTNAVDKRLAFLAENADIFPVKPSGYREVLIEKFPYLIVYKIIKKKNTVHVLHIFHTSRNPVLKRKTD